MQSIQAVERAYKPAGLLARLFNWRRFAVLAVAGAMLVACGPTQQDVPRRQTSQQQQRTTIPETRDPANIDPSTLGSTAPVRVALLAPLSGEHEYVGRALQRAAEMAVFETGGSNFNLIPIDTQGTPGGASAAASQAISQGAQMIIGPLFSSSVQAVRTQTQAANIPVIAFSTDPQVAGGNVYLLSFLPRPQVNRILDFASQQGITRVGIIAPDNDYGRTVVQYAQAASTRLNLQITQVGFYATNGENLREAIQSFTNTVDMRRSRDRARSLRAVRSAPLNFDAVLIPDGGQRLRSVSSILAFFDVDPNEVRYLGTGLWDSDLVRLENNLHGGWFAGPPPGSRDRFVIKYRQAYNEEPPRIASLAYDAVALAGALSRRGAEGDRFSHQAITNPSGFHGIDGIFRFGPDGLSDRGVAVMQVTPEEFRVIGDAPLTFETGTN